MRALGDRSGRACGYQCFRMTCYHPQDAYLEEGRLRFDHAGCQRNHTMKIACGRCIGCRLDHARSWAVRMCAEMRTHSQNCFITLTYNDEHLPANRSLSTEDWQKFMKRLRKKTGPGIKFYHAGEYGEEDWRPHDHAILFGYDFPDKEFFKWSPSGHAIYRSKVLEDAWSVRGSSLGYSSVQDANFDTASYVARYVVKKRTNPAGTFGPGPAEWHYKGRKPEYSSNSNGIGERYYELFGHELWRDGYMIANGHKQPICRFLREKMKAEDPARYDEFVFDGEAEMQASAFDRLPHRLKAREICHKAKHNNLKREL